MESRFGHDFSRVRVHTDALAAESARAVGALAYTVGSDIVFAEGRYAPKANEGRRLLAHELAHTVQQASSAWSGSHNLHTTSLEEAEEKEARTAEQAIVQGQSWAHALDAPLQIALDVRRPAPPSATPACPGGVKTVGVDMVSLGGANRNPPGDLDFANAVFRPCCVRFAMGTGVTTTPELSDAWLGDTDIQKAAACGAPTAEESNTYTGATATFGLSSRIRAFYVVSASSGDRAYSWPPYCAGGAVVENMVVVTNTAALRSLAHELGHILLNSGTHPPGTDNLMHPTNTATGEVLTPEQCAAIYASA